MVTHDERSVLQPKLDTDDRGLRAALMGSQTWMKLFGGSAPHHDIPSIDYYFLGALRDLVSGSSAPSPDRPIVRCGPTTFRVNDRLVIVRYLSQKELFWIRAHGFSQIYYVIDDML